MVNNCSPLGHGRVDLSPALFRNSRRNNELRQRTRRQGKSPDVARWTCAGLVKTQSAVEARDADNVVGTTMAADTVARKVRQRPLPTGIGTPSRAVTQSFSGYLESA